MSNGGLPNYLKMAKPNPMANRAPWYKNTAQTYAGIMLWFVFWNEVPVGRSLQPGTPYSAFAGGILSQGLVVAILGVIFAALICHFLFYMVPGMLGMKSGLPLYIVGTSTYGAQGGFLMPGFLMGVLQFGWLAVNAFFAGVLLCAPFGQGPGTLAHAVVATLWAVAAGFMGLKGIQYVAKVATFLPLIPLVILVILVLSTIGGLGDFDSQKLIDAGAAVEVKAAAVEGAPEAQPVKAAAPLSSFAVIALILTYIVGFFATAGAAGADFGMNNRDAKDVQMGGLVGIAGATIFAGCAALLIVAGAHGGGKAGDPGGLAATSLMGDIMGSPKIGSVFMYLLAIAAFPPACFSSFIAANSFKTTLPNVKPMVSCGIGVLAAVILAVTGLAGDAAGVFSIIGASFGPVCGAMMVDYLLSGRKWAGPRAGINAAGWISWLVGFIVGIAPMVGLANIPAAPVAAFIVGAVLYFALAKAGLEPQVIPMVSEPEAGAPKPPVAGK
ncbi:MAG: cytosine permease [Phycisphaerae bacterium]|nr:cytosine permease [Phycisphaerae bacterium]